MPNPASNKHRRIRTETVDRIEYFGGARQSLPTWKIAAEMNLGTAHGIVFLVRGRTAISRSRFRPAVQVRVGAAPAPASGWRWPLRGCRPAATPVAGRIRTSESVSGCPAPRPRHEIAAVKALSGSLNTASATGMPCRPRIANAAWPSGPKPTTMQMPSMIGSVWSPCGRAIDGPPPPEEKPSGIDSGRDQAHHHDRQAGAFHDQVAEGAYAGEDLVLGREPASPV
jgi:hypothetical protein